ncbi:MAG: NADH-quinone oxidoreductase subunit L [Dehalococcoidaceae bacterium]|nr:NADH-quinone oxidoreductase subunit L [Dehalococcoidaceae bacterium]
MNNIPEQLIWMIPGLPLAAFVALFILVRSLKIRSNLNGYLAIAATAASFALSLWVAAGLFNAPAEHGITGFEWLNLGGILVIELGLTINPLTGIMLVVVTLVSLLVQIYSLGYMHGSKSLNRYFAFISLFTFAMLGLVMADNLLIMFMCWELVGLCSYLLIGFWYHRPAAAQAARKAFFITRIGDFGFLAAILLLFTSAGTLNVNDIHAAAIAGAVSSTVITWAALGIFMGAMGKSAQFPLHTWLPDAMEGPTPVSALIHAATMVASGVFLVGRMYPLFELSPTALSTVATIGAVTALFAGTIALVMHDIKKVLAYSTISQLGYMMLGLGLGDVAIALFHLFTHAFFKALLFMGAGSVNHSTGTFDMRKMGGLARLMPWTCATFVIGSLSLSGIWPLAGFFSKEEILNSALSNQPVLFAMALLTAFMTAFYMFRVVFLTFGGEYQSRLKPHESGKVMIIPMLVLAVLAVSAGWLNLTGRLTTILGHGHEQSWIYGFLGIFTHPLAWISLAVAGSGIFLAWAMYQKRWLSARKVAWTFRSAYTVFFHKYWIDELYEKYIGARLFNNGLFNLFNRFDAVVIDGTVNDVAGLNLKSSKAIRTLQNGRLTQYGLVFLFGIAAIALLVIFTG